MHENKNIRNQSQEITLRYSRRKFKLFTDKVIYKSEIAKWYFEIL